MNVSLNDGDVQTARNKKPPRVPDIVPEHEKLQKKATLSGSFSAR